MPQRARHKRMVVYSPRFVVEAAQDRIGQSTGVDLAAGPNILRKDLTCEIIYTLTGIMLRSLTTNSCENHQGRFAACGKTIVHSWLQ